MSERRGTLLQATLLRFVRRGAWSNARKLLDKSHPADVAQVLDRLTTADRRAVFDLIQTPALRAEVLALLDVAVRGEIFGELEAGVASAIVAHLPTDDAADILRQLPREASDEILEALGDAATEVEALLGHSEGTAGAIMLPEPFALSEQLTAKEAIEAIQSEGDTEASFYVYVIDDRRHLVGVLSLRQLIRQPPYTELRACMVTNPIRVTTETDQEEVSQLVARYDLLAVPVVDGQGRLVGVVTVDDVIDVMALEATEDILKLAGTTVEEVTSPSVFRGAWIRFPWLAASFIGGGAGIFLMQRLEVTLQTTVQLAFFLPIILGMGGNVGSQCSMVVVRGLATGRLELRSLGWIVGHEIGTSVILATLFAAMLGGLAALVGFGPPRLALVVMASMFASMLSAAAVGTLFPLGFDRIGVDPAVASGPFVTTSTDVMGILAFGLVAIYLL